MDFHKSLHLFTCLIFTAALISACGASAPNASLNPTIKATEKSLAAFPGKPGAIQLTQESNGEVKFIGDGEVYEKGSSSPLILYATDSAGVLDFVAGIASPLVKINPAILDLSGTSSTAIPIGTQLVGSDIHSSVWVSSATYKRFLIDGDYVVYPLTEADMYLSGGTQEPFINVRLFDGQNNEIKLTSVSVEVASISGGKLQSGMTSDGSLLVMGVPREPLKVTATQSRSSWQYDLYPAFRGSMPGVVEYQLLDISFGSSANEGGGKSSGSTDPEKLIIGAWKCSIVSWQFLADGTFVWNNRGYQQTGTYKFLSDSTFQTQFSNGYSEVNKISVSSDQLYFEGSDLCTRVE